MSSFFLILPKKMERQSKAHAVFIPYPILFTSAAFSYTGWDWFTLETFYVNAVNALDTLKNLQK